MALRQSAASASTEFHYPFAPILPRHMSELVKNNRRLHLPLLILAFSALLAGLWAGLLRLGLALPSLGVIPAGAHGPLMVAGFLGTLIALERAVALRQGRQLLPGTRSEDASARRPDSRLYFLVPLLSGLGALSIFLNIPLSVPKVLFALSVLGFTLLNFILAKRLPDKASATLAAGAVLYLDVGTFRLGAPLPIPAELCADSSAEDCETRDFLVQTPDG